MNESSKKSCSLCKAAFTCGMASDNCWCYQFPPIFQPEAGTACLCPACLKAATITRINAYVATITPETAMANKAKKLPKVADQLDIDFYIENSLQVFTAWNHLKRGYCCKSNCRHCPYGFK